MVKVHNFTISALSILTKQSKQPKYAIEMRLNQNYWSLEHFGRVQKMFNFWYERVIISKFWPLEDL